MTHADFDRLVEQTERDWMDRTDGLVRRVGLWAFSGQAVMQVGLVGGVLLLGLLAWWSLCFPGLLSGGVTMIAGVPLVLGVWVLLGAVMGGMMPSRGVSLDTEPEEKWRLALQEAGLPMVGLECRVDASFRLEWMPLPRWGFWGSSGSRLVMGLPLLELLGVEEFRMLLAREADKATGRTMADRWCRLRARWELCVDWLERDEGRKPVKELVHWYWPRFNARALVLARRRELLADQTVAEKWSAGLLPQVICRIEVARCQRREKWRQLTDPLSKCPADVYETLFKMTPGSWGRWKGQVWLKEAYEEGGERFDPLPPLGDRLKALGVKGVPEAVGLRPAGDQSAAEALISPKGLAKLRNAIGTKCRLEAEEEWLRGQDDPGSMIDGEGAEREGKRSARRSWERISALARLDGLEKVQGEIEGLLEDVPGHSGALYLRASHLAKQGDAGALDLFEQAALDPTMSAQVFQSLCDYHSALNQPDEVKAVRERAKEHDARMREALVERNRVTRKDRFFPAGLSEEVLADLKATLEREEVVQGAWLVGKEVAQFPEWKHYVLMMRLEWPSQRFGASRDEQKVIDRIVARAGIDGYVHVLLDEPANRSMCKAILKVVPGAEVMRRRFSRPV